MCSSLQFLVKIRSLSLSHFWICVSFRKKDILQLHLMHLHLKKAGAFNHQSKAKRYWYQSMKCQYLKIILF